MKPKQFQNLLLGEFPEEREQHEQHLPYPLCDFCPHCKRDIYPPERPFDMKTDNHMDRCVHERGLSQPKDQSPEGGVG